MNANTTNTETLERELKETALLIAEHAEAESWSKAEMIRQLPALKSDRTFDRVKAGDFASLGDIAALHAAYRGVLDGLAAQDKNNDPLYSDMSTAKRVRAAVMRLKLSRTLARLVIVKGYTGSGKSSALKIVADLYNSMTPNQQVFSMDATVGWSDSPIAMMGDMLVALGAEEGPARFASRRNRLLALLRAQNIILTIDEVHDLGAKCLRQLKYFITNTAVKIVMACHPRLWRELEASASDDLSQLMGNRLLAVVDLGTLSVDDVALMLTRRLPGVQMPADLPKKLAEMALHHGNLAFIREVIVRGIQVTERTRKPADQGLLLQCASKELADRGSKTAFKMAA